MMVVLIKKKSIKDNKELLDLIRSVVSIGIGKRDSDKPKELLGKDKIFIPFMSRRKNKADLLVQVERIAEHENANL